MDIKVSIEFNGSPEEVGDVLGRLSEVLGNGGDLDSTDELHAWTHEAASEFVSELTDVSLQALATIAKHAPRAKFVDVRRDMAKRGMNLAPGSLSSIGFAMRRLGFANPPFLRDYYQRAYLMDPATVELFGPSIEKELERRSLPRA